MKWEDLERNLGDYVNSNVNTISGSDQAYYRKVKVWEQIEKRLYGRKNIKRLRWMTSVAAGILLIISLTFLVTVSQKNKTIAYLKADLSTLKEKENNLFSEVNKLQSQIMNNKNTDSAVIISLEQDHQNDKTNITELPVQNTNQISINKDSLYRIILDDPIFSDFFMTGLREPVLADSIMTNKLFLSDLGSENGNLEETFKKGIVHYKIDYGDMRSDNDTLQRPWKVTITYQ